MVFTSSSYSSRMETTLLNTLHELQIRTEVEDALKEMVTDVELAHGLGEKVTTQSLLSQLQSHVQQQEDALQESRAVSLETQSHQSKLADSLVREMWNLSLELGDMEELKAKHQALVMEHDEVVARLLQAQQDLEDAQEQAQRQAERVGGGGGVDGRSAVVVSEEQEKKPEPQVQVLTKAPPQPAVEFEQAGEKPIAQDQAGTASSNTTTTTTHIDTVQEEEPLEEQEPAAAATADAPAAPAAAPPHQQEPPVVLESSPAVVALVHENDDDDNDDDETVEDCSPTFEQLETNVLMQIFAYLDALDILNVAQVNVSMYSRVDSLFGLGPQQQYQQLEDNSTIASSSQDETLTTTSAPEPTVSTTAVTSAPTPTVDTTTTSASTPTPPSAASSAKASAAAASAVPGPRSTVTSTPTKSEVPPPPPKAPTPSAAAAVAAATTAATPASINKPMIPTTPTSSASAAAAAVTRFDGPRALFHSILQPRKAMTPTSSPSPTRAGVMQHKRSASAAETSNFGLSSSPAAAHPAPAPMNAAMANSMAAKLTDAELNAIVLMTERLKQKEEMAYQLVRENQDLIARVDAVESMRDFLVARVSEMEFSLSTSEDNEAKVAQQIASDQEVVAFLDGRVQELEGETRRLEADKVALQQELARVREQVEQKSQVMGDMLQFERERVVDNDREWRIAKRLLIREVKSCRAHIVALQAERDGYREQNELLRKAVLASSSAGGSSTHQLKSGHLMNIKNRDRVLT